MKTPTKEQVQEYFKNAKLIEDKYGDTIYYSNFNLDNIYNNGEDWFVDDEFRNNDILLYCSHDGYAEIIEYKDIKEQTPENEFKQITNSISELLEYKNKKYGRSALNPINIFQGKTKVGQRLDDKISRVKNSDVLRKNDIADIIGYLILVCKENNWNDFSEFKD